MPNTTPQAAMTVTDEDVKRACHAYVAVKPEGAQHVWASGIRAVLEADRAALASARPRADTFTHPDTGAASVNQRHDAGGAGAPSALAARVGRDGVHGDALSELRTESPTASRERPGDVREVQLGTGAERLRDGQAGGLAASARPQGAEADLDADTRSAVDRLRAMTKGPKAGRADYGQFLSGRDAVLLTQHIDALTARLGVATPQPAPVEGAPRIVDDGAREWQWSPHVGLLTRFRGEHWGPAFADNITEANRPLIASLLARPTATPDGPDA